MPMGTGIDFRPFFSQSNVIRTVPRLGEIVLVEEIPLVDIGKEEHAPAICVGLPFPEDVKPGGRVP